MVQPVPKYMEFVKQEINDQKEKIDKLSGERAILAAKRDIYRDVIHNIQIAVANNTREVISADQPNLCQTYKELVGKLPRYGIYALKYNETGNKCNIVLEK